jgi:hypothetical protein
MSPTLTGSERISVHLAKVSEAAEKLEHGHTGRILTRSIKELQDELDHDLLDKYQTQGVDPIRATRGRLVTAAALKLGAEEYEADVQWLIEHGWLTPLNLPGRTVYSFDLGEVPG